MNKTKFTSKELQLFSRIINKQLKSEKKQLKSAKKMLTDQRQFMQSSDLNRNEHVLGMRNVKMLKRLKNKSQKRVQKLQRAKDRIEDKTYGICKKTGNMISKQRLYVIPEARFSVAKKYLI